MQPEYFRPDFNEVLFTLWGPFKIRWYSVLYVGAFLLARFILKKLSKEKRFQFTASDMEDFTMWLLVGAVIGARVIYCVFYSPKDLLANPLFLFQIWKGGLSFHGGLLGTIVSAMIFSRQRGIPFLNLTDAMALSAPLGLAMGRLGNFINGELYGRVTTVPWAMIFPRSDGQPRHPSQLYELFLEGFVTFGILWFAKRHLKKDGQLSILFLLAYTSARFTVEFFREPDAHLGFLSLGLSMGQWLSIAQFTIGIGLGLLFYKKYWVYEK